MMNVSIDPSETRDTRPSAKVRSAPRSKFRVALLGGLAIGAVAAFSAASMSLLGGLAASPKPAGVKQIAANWPDLKDGVPALVTGSLSVEPAPVSTPVVPTAAPETPMPLRAAIDAEAKPIEPQAAPQPAPTAPKTASAPAKRAPMIEYAATVAPVREAALLAPPARTAHVVAPSKNETVKARTADVAFAALPAAPAREAAPETPKDVAKEAAKPRLKVAAPKPPAPKRSEVASAEAAPAPTAAEEPETTEVFGMKVPSLAPAGRKIRESVEALGEAVKGLPEKF
ncbi:hypothetical protein [Methylobacterium segetis]|uniref:hypothetical protein n=1 Tax=Methylobacterium segetis TaxID=2488750 RepID=UPI00104D2477|nr:hypothetical protein [Methylobacterium segetis]